MVCWLLRHHTAKCLSMAASGIISTWKTGTAMTTPDPNPRIAPKAARPQATALAARNSRHATTTNPEERTMLRLLEGALETSDYVDKVEITSSWQPLSTRPDADHRPANHLGGAACCKRGQRVRHGVPLAARGLVRARLRGRPAPQNHEPVKDAQHIRQAHVRPARCRAAAPQWDARLLFVVAAALPARSTLFGSGRDGNVAAAALMRDPTGRCRSARASRRGSGRVASAAERARRARRVYSPTTSR